VEASSDVVILQDTDLQYAGRTHDEGKKISWKDGVRCGAS
jgi:hypothetical protein